MVIQRLFLITTSLDRHLRIQAVNVAGSVLPGGLRRAQAYPDPRPLRLPQGGKACAESLDDFIGLRLGALPERHPDPRLRGGKSQDERGDQVPLRHERDPATRQDHRAAEDRPAPSRQADLGPPL